MLGYRAAKALENPPVRAPPQLSSGHHTRTRSSRRPYDQARRELRQPTVIPYRSQSQDFAECPAIVNHGLPSRHTPSHGLCIDSSHSGMYWCRSAIAVVLQGSCEPRCRSALALVVAIDIDSHEYRRFSMFPARSSVRGLGRTNRWRLVGTARWRSRRCGRRPDSTRRARSWKPNIRSSARNALAPSRSVHSS